MCLLSSDKEEIMLSISLKKAEKEDLMFYFALRNEPGVMESSFNPEPINLETHRKWFFQKLTDLNSFLFVVLCRGRAIGQVRLDIEQDMAEINIAIAPEHRKRGYGSIAIEEACKSTFDKVPRLTKIFAHIKVGNVASVRSFGRAGFVEIGAVNYKDNECLEMILERRLR